MARVIEAPGAGPVRWVVPASVALALPVAWLASSHLGLAMVDRGTAALLAALVLSPLLEELVLRRLLQRELAYAMQRRGIGDTAAAWTAAAGTTAAFALIHLPAWRLDALAHCLPWLLPGAALAATWCWRRRTSDCVLLHAFFNAVLWWMSPGESLGA